MQLPDDVHLKLATFDPEQAASWARMLSEEERQRMAGFKSAKRRQEFLLGRVVVRSLLGELIGVEPSEVYLGIHAGGALECTLYPYYISLAHSGDRAVAVASSRQVGVDMERINTRHPDLPRFLLHPEEYALLDATPLERDRLIILLWTIKEATLKAMRTGLRISPTKLRTLIDLERQTATVCFEEASAWQALFEQVGDCYLSVVFPEQPVEDVSGRFADRP